MSTMVEIWEPKTETSANRQVMAVIRGVPGLGAKYIVSGSMEELDGKVAEFLRDLEIAETKKATAPIRRMASTWRNSWRKLREDSHADRGDQGVRPADGSESCALPGAGE